jgi:hypothetical protein
VKCGTLFDVMRKGKFASYVWSAALVTSQAFAGAWGFGSFENDDALDWVSELERASGPKVLADALRDINPGSKYVEAPDCSVALAAAETVAAAHGRASKGLPGEASAWLKRVKPVVGAELVERARTAVTFCRDDENSELRQLWAASKDFQAWLADTANLLSRLE